MCMYMPRDTSASQEKERSTERAAIPRGSKHVKSPDDCLLSAAFRLPICPQELPVSSSETEVELVASSLPTPHFLCQTGFSTKQKRLEKNLNFHLKTQISQRALSLHFWYFGAKSFSGLEEKGGFGWQRSLSCWCPHDTVL